MEQMANQHTDKDRLTKETSFRPSPTLKATLRTADAPCPVSVNQVKSIAWPCAHSPPSSPGWHSGSSLPQTQAKDGSVKYGLFKKFLRRTTNCDAKNRIKVIETRSPRPNRNSNDNPLFASNAKVMGNVHQISVLHILRLQGNPVPEQEAPQAFIDSPQRNSNAPSSLRETTGTVNNTLHLMPVTTVDSGRQQGDLVLTPDVCQAILNGPTKTAQSPCEHDTVVQLQLLVERLRATIRNRDRRIQDLEREVDKLRSVLDQQIADSWGAKESNASALQTISLNHEISSPLAQVPSVSDREEATVSSPSNVPLVVDVLETSSSTPPIAAALLLHKRLGVSGESMRAAKELKYFEKDAK
ncbi:uncharacterized protein DEA37_0007762 [Paragonimus westermani]|uniref:Uncharacterized protein n=1 Tax=Paragonimus westermani TaxID=34504 RepID=A0A5J4NG70_9TREM|nr:uncharacterized protein DEA37_0007762 [Paragonimus westermani]